MVGMMPTAGGSPSLADRQTQDRSESEVMDGTTPDDPFRGRRRHPQILIKINHKISILPDFEHFMNHKNFAIFAVSKAEHGKTKKESSSIK